ncbi:hypothetical protein U9M48_020909 [Paspalum notatum var. saurae]|uniref:Uncharacterized protein n=1 Tax=Paspalum notatum var. saurae TaxID=547442 RepID=A0AAQ3TFR5_PASNO
MMACRRLAREAAAASLRRGATNAPAAPARAFSAAAAAASCSSRAPVAASPIRQSLARYSSPAFQPRAAEFGFGQSLAARAALGLRQQMSGRNLLKGFGTSTVLGMALHQGKATAETKELPSRAITGPPPGSLKNELRSFWPLIRKLQLPIGLVILIMCGLQSPISLVLNVLLLVYCSRPSRYSIYLFLQELRHRESDRVHWNEEILKNRVHWKEESMRTRNVDAKDHKFFSIGTVELTDGRVLHLIGMLGSWWIYHVSYVK